MLHTQCGMNYHLIIRSHECALTVAINRLARLLFARTLLHRCEQTFNVETTQECIDVGEQLFRFCFPKEQLESFRPEAESKNNYHIIRASGYMDVSLGRK